jgi:hypothetical protein
MRTRERRSLTVDRSGVQHPSAYELGAAPYVMEEGAGGQLYIEHQLATGTRLAGVFDVEQLVRNWHRIRRRIGACSPRAHRAYLARPLSHSRGIGAARCEILCEQLATLEPGRISFKAAIQQLRRVANMRRIVE